MGRNDIKSNYMLWYPLKNLARKELQYDLHPTSDGPVHLREPEFHFVRNIITHTLQNLP